MQQRATLALLLCALVGGAAATKGPLISGIREAKQAAISGIREHHEAKISGLRTKFFSKHAWLVPEAPAVSGAPGTTLTPTVTPAECLSVAEVAKAAGNFSTLLAAAQVSAVGAAVALLDLLRLLILLALLPCTTPLLCSLAHRRRCLPPLPPPPAPAGRRPGPRPVRPQPAGHRVCPH